MLDKTYDKLCNCGQLHAEIVAAGLVQVPAVGGDGRFFGVSAVSAPASTTVHFVDDRTEEEEAQVDALVAAHTPA